MKFLEMHIEVADLEISLAFYEKILPVQKVVRWQDGSAAALVLPDGTAFGLWLKGKKGIHDGQGAEHLHFAFQIKPEEYDHYLQKFKERGIETLEYDWPDGHRSIYFFDPDHHQGELMTKDWLGRSE